jgi:hypothetical protein
MVIGYVPEELYGLTIRYDRLGKEGIPHAV